MGLGRSGHLVPLVLGSLGPLVPWSPGPLVPGPLVPFACAWHQAIKKNYNVHGLVLLVLC